MSAPQGPSSFETSTHMAAGAKGASGGDFGMLQSLIGTKMEEEVLHFLSETPLQVTGFNNMEGGLFPMLFKMRGEGFLGRLLDGFASADEAFGAGAGMDGSEMMSEFPTGTGGGDGGGSDGGNFGNGSNRAFSSLPPMDMVGPMSDVPEHMLGQLSPSQSPGMGRGGVSQEMGM